MTRPPTEARKARILIVDDHPIMRVGIAAIINAQPNMEVIGQAGTAAEAVRLSRRCHPRRHPDGPPPARPQRRRGHPRDPRPHPQRPHHRPHHLRG